MLTLTGNGRLTRDVELRTTRSGKRVATVSVASDRRDRRADPIYVDLVLWEAQAEAAAQHLVRGQAVAFSGRFEPRPYQTSSGEQRVALEVTRRRPRVRPQAPRRRQRRARARRPGRARAPPPTTSRPERPRRRQAASASTRAPRPLPIHQEVHERPSGPRRAPSAVAAWLLAATPPGRRPSGACGP